MNVIETKRYLLIHLKGSRTWVRYKAFQVSFYLTLNLHLSRDNLISFCYDL